MIRSEHLLDQAFRLAKAPRKGKPRQADLRRAISSAYYAVFHAALKDGADHLVGSSPAKRSTKAWALIYRAYQHGEMAKRCGSLFNPPSPLTPADFSSPVRQFAAEFRTLQNDRHRADYDPAANFKLSYVRARVSAARTAITELKAASADDRTLFATYLLLGVRSSA